MTSKSPIRSGTSRAKASERLGPLSLAEMRRPPSHPGEIFREEFRASGGLSQIEASNRLGFTDKGKRLNEIEKGKRSVTADTALRFAALTGTSPEFWMRLQAAWDLWHAYQERKKHRAA